MHPLFFRREPQFGLNMKIRGLILVCLMLLVLGGWVLADWRVSAKPWDYPKTYVGRNSCVECHRQQAELYHGSHHDLAMDLASDSTVLGNFDNQELEHFGVLSKMYRDGKRFMVRTDGPDGNMADFEVKYVFGHHPLQQYLVETDRPVTATADEIGRVQVLRISWDVENKKWFYLMPPDVNERLEHTDPLHWTGVTQNWNSSCAYCHSTNVRKNFDTLSAQFRTTLSEIDVSCEACHGPGSLHVELAGRRSLFWDRNHRFGLAKLKAETNRSQIETCAQCHSRRIMIAEGFQAGCNYDDFFALQTLTDPIYHFDGQQRDENFVYGSFTQSRMYHNGVKCSDCHDSHSLKLKNEDNAVCTSCHQHPAGKYDTPLHHHHAVGKPGSFCVDCHMPETVYMMCDPRRDHSFRVPRPDLSVAFGTPNACSGCHLDQQSPPTNRAGKPLRQYLDWILASREGNEPLAARLRKLDQDMLTAVEAWYPSGQSEPKSNYYDRLTKAQANAEQNLPTLMGLSRDLAAPAIFRATAFELLARFGAAESVAVAMAGLKDPEPKVIAAALIPLEIAMSQTLERRQYAGASTAFDDELSVIGRAIVPLLRHESRRVRAEAARVLLTMPVDLRNQIANAEQRRALENALAEYRNALLVEQDRAHFQLSLAALAEWEGNQAEAMNRYRTAIKIEPYLSGTRSNLAVLIQRQIDELTAQLPQLNPDADAAARTRIQTQIDQLNQQVRQLRVEDHQLLAQDIERAANIPGTHGLHYQFAMSCYLQDDLAGTEKHLLEANRQDPNNQAYLLGLATYYIHVKQAAQAEKFIQFLLKLQPNHPAYLQLKEQANAKN
jgi:Flp pilus assembly protein TadD